MLVPPNRLCFSLHYISFYTWWTVKKNDNRDATVQNSFRLSILKDKRKLSAFSPIFSLKASSITITGQLLDQDWTI